MSPKQVYLLLLLVIVSIVNAKVYNKCAFAKQLKAHGISSRAQIATWTCIASHESGFNTKAINKVTGDYGILQISHLYWCSNTNKKGKGCNITCASLLTDNISEDIKCAKHIYSETAKLSKKSGFTAWVTYKKYCTGNQSKWISGCRL